MPKGEKVLAQSKRTAPPPISKKFELSLVKGKAFETGEKISNLENAS
jgi:hypothetical protein